MTFVLGSDRRVTKPAMPSSFSTWGNAPESTFDTDDPGNVEAIRAERSSGTVLSVLGCNAKEVGIAGRRAVRWDSSLHNLSLLANILRSAALKNFSG